MKNTIIQIPDRNLRQFPGRGPTFISVIPPDIQGLEIRVSRRLAVHLSLIQNHSLKEYLEKIERLAAAKNFKVKREQDLEADEFIYTFESLTEAADDIEESED